MARGAKALAQLPDDEAAKVVVPYRATPAQRRSINEVLAEEVRAKTKEGKKVPTLSKVVGYLVSLGLDFYWVRHELGEQFDAVAEEYGRDRRMALRELLRRGLEKKGKR